MTSSATIEAVPGRVDSAVIATPAQGVPDVISQCHKRRQGRDRALLRLLKESGPDGAAVEREVLECAREGKLRALGHHCRGVIRPVTGLDASFASDVARPGTVGFASQTGARCTSILDGSLPQQFGFSAFISGVDDRSRSAAPERKPSRMRVR